MATSAGANMKVPNFSQHLTGQRQEEHEVLKNAHRKLQENLREVTNERNALQEERNKLQEECDALRKNTTRDLQCLSNANDRRNELQGQCDKLQEECDALREEYEELKQGMEDLEQDYDMLVREHLVDKEYSKNRENKCFELEAERNKLVKERNTLQRQLNEATTELQSMRTATIVTVLFMLFIATSNTESIFKPLAMLFIALAGYGLYFLLKNAPKVQLPNPSHTCTCRSAPNPLQPADSSPTAQEPVVASIQPSATENQNYNSSTVPQTYIPAGAPNAENATDVSIQTSTQVNQDGNSSTAQKPDGVSKAGKDNRRFTQARGSVKSALARAASRLTRRPSNKPKSDANSPTARQ